MGTESSIGWTTHTWNIGLGCTAKTSGCDHCYMKALAKRNGWPGEGDLHIYTSPDTFTSPLAKARGGVWRWAPGSFVFTSSLADISDPAWDPVRPLMWRIMRARQDLTFQVLTKLPLRLSRHLPDDWGEYGYPNVWIGASVAEPSHLERMVKGLEAVRAVVRFLSIEPALRNPMGDTAAERRLVVELLRKKEPIARWSDLHTGERKPEKKGPCHISSYSRPLIQWAILGGESGGGARPFDVGWLPDWLREVQIAGIAPFVKQLGSRPVRWGQDPRTEQWGLQPLRLEDRKGEDISQWPGMYPQMEEQIRRYPQPESIGAVQEWARIEVPPIELDRGQAKAEYKALVADLEAREKIVRVANRPMWFPDAKLHAKRQEAAAAELGA